MDGHLTNKVNKPSVCRWCVVSYVMIKTIISKKEKHILDMQHFTYDVA